MSCPTLVNVGFSTSSSPVPRVGLSPSCGHVFRPLTSAVFALKHRPKPDSKVGFCVKATQDLECWESPRFLILETSCRQPQTHACHISRQGRSLSSTTKERRTPRTRLSRDFEQQQSDGVPVSCDGSILMLMIPFAEKRRRKASLFKEAPQTLAPK